MLNSSDTKSYKQGTFPLHSVITENLNKIKNTFSNCSDVIYREFTIDSLKKSAALIFINELADIKLINENIISSLMNIKPLLPNDALKNNLIDIIKQRFLEVSAVDELTDLSELEEALLNGDSIFLLDGEIKALKFALSSFKGRSISEPTIEKVIRGPKEGFTEDINVNTAMLRRRIKSSNLKFENIILGRKTRTKVHLCYLDDIIDEDILNEIRKRLKNIDIDGVLEGGYIEQLIQDNPHTLFPQVLHTERPDRVAGCILEGKAGIFVDGTPFVLIAPSTMMLFLQTSEDYSERYMVSSFIRLVRFIFFVASLLLPGMYVAIVAYHREMIPTALLISIMESARKVPFPVLVEALIMEATFEALREAGIRLPIPANQTVGIVGALVIGDAAVKAGIISSIMVIIVSITAVASFSIPSYDLGYSIRILRFVMLFLGGLFGLYGILLGLLILFIHLTSLRSFGVNYMSPIAPLNLTELKDSFIRFPLWSMDKRPSFSKTTNRRRQKQNSKPEANKPTDER
jgi:spore germination protein KA